VVRDIGISRETLERSGSRLAQVEAEDVRRLLSPRRLDAHKRDFGSVAVIAGSRGKAGAAILCARAALRAGAGLVTVFCPESLEDVVVGALPEAMTRGLEESGGGLSAKAGRAAVVALEGFDAAVIGPGLGMAPGTVAAVEEMARRSNAPFVGDADFLNAFAGRPGLLAKRRSPTILTPHPGEAARLLGVSTRKVQADRVRAASALARVTRAVVVLKGAGTLTATRDGQLAVNPTGTPLLATAGSGDVLGGAIGALLAGGMAARDAAIIAVYLHGAAGELLAAQLGDAGLLTAELADALPLARKALCAAG
jgi:NAD(P)H-hydrate epimerase